MTHPNIVNLRNNPLYDIRIDRPHLLGNPYKIGDLYHVTTGGPTKLTRRMVIDLFEAYARTRMQYDLLFRASIADCRGKTIACWCAPFECHGEVILRLAEEIYVADEGKKIDRFAGPYRFLSNFWPSIVRVSHGENDIREYPTVEHAFQACKTLDMVEREEIRLAQSPDLAKKMGRQVTLRSDWNDIRIEVMHKLLRQKFAIPELRAKLLATGTADLIEGNDWYDQFWGVSYGVGENNLGKLLMKVRDEIKEAMLSKPAKTVK